MTCKAANGITLPLEKLFPKSTSLSNLMVKGCFFALFFLFCSSAPDMEFGKPVTRMPQFSSSNKIIKVDKAVTRNCLFLLKYSLTSHHIIK